MTKIFIPTCCLLLFVTSACTSSKMKESKINEEGFPPDFGSPDHILLVHKRTGGINPKGITNYIEKSFQKNYTGKYELASAEEIKNNSKYQDKNLYRFAVIYDVISHQFETYVDGRFVKRTGSNTDMHMYDRLHDKEYPSLGVKSNVPAKAINRTSVLLNTRLKK